MIIVVAQTLDEDDASTSSIGADKVGRLLLAIVLTAMSSALGTLVRRRRVLRPNGASALIMSCLVSDMLGFPPGFLNASKRALGGVKTDVSLEPFFEASIATDL
jgi:hypothetical protein